MAPRLETREAYERSHHALMLASPDEITSAVLKLHAPGTWIHGTYATCNGCPGEIYGDAHDWEDCPTIEVLRPFLRED